MFLTISAGSRFSEAAWGVLPSDASEDISVDGFMSVDLSDTLDSDAMRFASEGIPVQGLSSIQGAGIQDALEGISMRGAAFAFQRPAGAVPLPSEVDARETLPGTEGVELNLQLPSEAHIPLPMPVGEPVGDFGPLPKDLSDYESIVLNTAEDGLRLPDDSLGDLPDMELPDEDIILAEVGATWREHVVRSGETLSDIAMQYGGVTAQDILRSNGLKDANRLAAQQIILVPNSSMFIEDTLEEVRIRQARVASLRERAIPLKVVAYVVAAGDSLWSIANSQNLEVDTLIGSNAFRDSSMLHPGVTLRIPNQDGIFYKLKKGDAIESVAKKYQVALDRIQKVNPTIDLVSLKASDEIFLPGARPEAIADVQTTGKKSDSSAATKKSVASNTSEKGVRAYRWPVMGRINSPFGWRRHPITKRRDFHTGLDIKADRGTVVRSARDGRVAYAGWMGGYGKVVVVEHGNGQSTLYAHCSSLLVQQGASISVGQNIARVGTTGRSTGPHLHFEVRHGNSPETPLN
ncbi:MAG: LysM peptidoglycan-binding domain-containing M23 family metallopeptidase [Synergistaceae bacterium]|nr:LysM peptidoglycan-binding domain-containing M23 family metallopeptidase [Synergistaceae bacterium]